MSKIDNFVALGKKTGLKVLSLNTHEGCTGRDCEVGLDNCWAMRMIKRGGRSIEPGVYPERIKRIERKEPAIFVVNFLGDMFSGEQGKGERRWVEWLIEKLRLHPQHHYFFCTKHPEEYLEHDWTGIPNLWFGTTVCKEKDLKRLSILSQIFTAYRYIYFEPCIYHWEDKIGLTHAIREAILNWLLIGGKSKGTLPLEKVHPESVKALVNIAQEQKIPVFCKDNLKSTFPYDFDSLPREVPKL